MTGDTPPRGRRVRWYAIVLCAVLVVVGLIVWGSIALGGGFSQIEHRKASQGPLVGGDGGSAKCANVSKDGFNALMGVDFENTSDTALTVRSVSAGETSNLTIASRKMIDRDPQGGVGILLSPVGGPYSLAANYHASSPEGFVIKAHHTVSVVWELTARDPRRKAALGTTTVAYTASGDGSIRRSVGIDPLVVHLRQSDECKLDGSGQY